MQHHIDRTYSGTESASDAATLNRLLSARHTCRAYRPDPVPDDVIAGIVDIAKRTASWCNVQPWHLVVTSADATERFRRALVEHAETHPEIDSDFPFPDEYRGPYAERRREVGYALYNALGIERSDKEGRARQSFENFRMFGAPHVAILTTPAELGTYGAIDCGAFVGAFLLAAQAYGVATAPQGALAQHARFIRAYFGIGDERHLVCGISFGYSDTGHPANGFRATRVTNDEVMRIV
ncbi:nitroreductase [Burkholderia sp. Bp8963]|uniref:nitroreductase n=1 Tax=Burkholderia sp. Bp8963 TaxID=2184547 RepID=UPI000F59C278|nr:nitroreductase [Burkholderia sp. Bp8963]RQS63387.1 nitroreductase [Burkholderia sp. Bp8963]